MTKSLSRMRALWLAAGLAAFVIPGALPSFAATANTSFLVTAQVLSSCLVTATTLNFGTYSSVAADPATNTITATCTPTTDYTIAFDAGGGAGATVTSRSMTGVAHAQSLDYGIFTEVAHTNTWGDGTSGTVTVSGTGNGLAQNITAYGLIPGAQSVDPDTYNDTINVTLTY